jgi:ketosteroid isomerase-like protein
MNFLMVAKATWSAYTRRDRYTRKQNSGAPKEFKAMIGVALILSAATAPADAPPRCGTVALPAMVAFYARLTRDQDISRIARLYGRDGLLIGPGGTPITGAGEVARFLGGFAGYAVTDDTLTIEAIEPIPGGWRTRGHFSQHGTTPDKSAYAAHGKFTADWACAKSGWRVLRMATAPGETQ